MAISGGSFFVGLLLGILIGVFVGIRARTALAMIGRIRPSRCCSFCGLRDEEIYKLLGSAFGVYVCDRCASLGQEVLRSRSNKELGASRLELLAPGVFARCSFCGKSSENRDMFTGRGVRMCGTCSEAAQASLRAV